MSDRPRFGLRTASVFTPVIWFEMCDMEPRPGRGVLLVGKKPVRNGDFSIAATMMKKFNGNQLT